MTETVIIRDEPLRQRVVDLIQALNIEKPWEVTVKRHTKRRTLAQNRLYWRWVTVAADHVSQHTGYDKDDIHDFFKQKFLIPRQVIIGETISVIYSTKNLSMAEMSQYCENIDRWCASELGVMLPKPEELHEAR